MHLQGTMQVNSRGKLTIGGCDVVELAREFGTPLYIFDEDCIRNNCREFYRAFGVKEGLSRVIYAGKAFLTAAMCRIIASEGLGLDVVSGGELYTALAAGFPVENIYFHGNNKSYAEICQALEAGIGRFVVDNFAELELLSRLSTERGQVARVILRVTPGIEAHTHNYIRTGQIDSKFGFTLPNGQALEAARRVKDLPGIEFKGLHCHIGSQIFELEPYNQAAAVMMELAAAIKETTGLITSELDLGGGFGIYYTAEDHPQPINAYAETILTRVREEARALNLPQPLVIVEPGRAIIGPAGSTAYTVGTIKEIPGVRKYVAVDGGMADNIRPALYGAKYEAILANKANLPATETVAITGKCCESGDMLIWEAKLPRVEAGDILVISCTGAYGYTMASNYNRLGRPAAVLVREGNADLILKREDYNDLLRNDVVPARLICTR
ncbi:MAG: diaminopimelate decarboxylase [Moorella sp. (in: firmicutes)]|uniref:diaminopimelate decarboxylase n=1 Tax=Moorella sp. E308F TaxID=2572682 RepID=UPI0010FFBD3D|nr:diaminopimelate decarboxylase [Moorella sp. E308F]MDK2816657.1 diaminopimelate decarboxylase [Moorella sp. (in: firmicutes)]MDK2895707.1 diaminopimelate decarboxylase [Moorella sp. (in: firmicutes)]GEA15804.1 diaminopimelate decarboxylase [Moorella sp. E308F]